MNNYSPKSPNFIIGPAKSFSPSAIHKFRQLLKHGNQVNLKYFTKLIDKNPILLFYPSSNQPHAIAALKKPFSSHTKSIFHSAKTQHDPNLFRHELGWLVSEDNNHGLATEIIRLLSRHTNNIYCTVHQNNHIIQHLLHLNNYQSSGKLFPSKRGNYKLKLFIKQLP